MSLEATIDTQYKEALKAHDSVTVGVFRMLKSALKNAAIEARHALSSDEEVAVLQREVKRRRESIAVFTDGGRKDLADTEQVELTILEKFLPAQMADDQLEAIVQEVITSQNATAKDFGKVMGAVMAKVKGQADGTRVTPIVKKLLH